MNISPQRFDSLLAIPGLRHSFLLRSPDVRVAVERDQALANLEPHFCAGIEAIGGVPEQLATCEQVHGGVVLQVDQASGMGHPLPGADGLITDSPEVLLGIYVADCCAVFIADRRGRAVGLGHSGKKGTEAGIAPTAIRRMADLGVPPEDLLVQLSPCIRPPAYEVDFAAQIRGDCAAAGVPPQQIHDEGTCTSRDLDRYYSYRAERGKTGRMLALLGLATG